MATSGLLRVPAHRAGLATCWRCTASAATADPLSHRRRSIGTKYLAKVADAEAAWNDHAVRIRAGEAENVWKMLEARGLVHDVVGSRKDLEELMVNKRIGFYAGIDPTAASLHVGHLMPLMSVFWLYVKGFASYTLIGTATAQVGDPTGRLKSREKLESRDRKANAVAIHYQLKKLWQNVEAYGRRYGHEKDWAWRRGILENNAWHNKLPFLEVLRLMGTNFRVGAMLSRETVKQKLEKGDGLSFAEFSYPLLQAFDFWELYRSRGVQVQIGGSDQFGNILSGVEAVKHIKFHHYSPELREEAHDPLKEIYGFTAPLLTTSSGEKFGKSAGNAVWLDPNMTSPFDLYGYFVKTPDDQVEKLLKIFTFVPLSKIAETMEAHVLKPEARVAQHLLAAETLELIHGVDIAKEVAAQHRSLFTRSEGTGGEDAAAAGAVSEEAAIKAFTSNPSTHMTLPESLVLNQTLSKVLFSAGLAPSRSAAHRLLSAGGVYMGFRFEPIKDPATLITEKTLSAESTLVLRVGKAKVKVIGIVPDSEYEAMESANPEMETSPGWKFEEKAAAKRASMTPEELANQEEELAKGREIRDARNREKEARRRKRAELIEKSRSAEAKERVERRLQVRERNKLRQEKRELRDREF